MATVASLMVRIGGDISDLEKSLSKASRRMQDAGKQMSQLGKTISKRVTAPLAALGGVAVAAFAKQEKAELQLRAALQANGREVESLFTQYTEFASAMQAVSVVGDETSIKMLAQAEALGLTGEAAMRAVKNSIAMQSAFDVNSRSALRYTAALEQGNSTMLARYIPSLRELDDESERVALAQDILGRAFSAAEAEADSSVGQLQQMKNTIGDLMEEFGALILEAIKPFTDWIQSLVTDVRAMDDRTKKLIITIAGVAAAIGPTILIIGKLITVLGLLMSPVGLTIAGITALAGLATFVVKNWQAFKDRFVRLWVVVKNSVIEAVASMVESLSNFFSAIPGVGGLFTGLAVKIREFKSEVPSKEDAAEFQTFGEFMTDVGGDIGDLFSWLSDQIFPKATEETNKLTIATRKLGNALKIPQGELKKVEGNTDSVAVALGETKKQAEIMGDALQSTVSSAITSFAETLGNVFTGDAGASGFFNNILLIVADFGKQLGRMLVAAGVAALAFKKLITNPVAAIVAGGALIAASTIVANLLKKGPEVPEMAQGGLAFGPTLAVVGDNPGVRSDPEVIAPLSKLQGMGGDNKVEVFGRLRGEDIFISSDRGGRTFNR